MEAAGVDERDLGGTEAMILSDLISQVQQQTGLQRDTILRRAREAWPTCIDFKEVQVRLMVDALTKEIARVRPINRALHLGALTRPMRVM